MKKTAICSTLKEHLLQFLFPSFKKTHQSLERIAQNRLNHLKYLIYLVIYTNPGKTFFSENLGNPSG